MKRLIRFLLRRLPRGVMQRLAPAAARVASLGYLGRGAECPICGGRYRKFMPYGYVEVRPNALCPGCLSLERHRLMELWLRRRTDFYDTSPRVLHVAPEACFIKRFRRRLGERYVTADLCSPLADVKMDVQSIPFAEGSFDVILCNHLLEHVDDDAKAMRELHRVLKPGGWAIMQVPVDHSLSVTDEDPSVTSPEERTARFGQYDHVRRYGCDYPERLAAAGFTVEADDFAARLPEELARLHALPREEVIYRVKKRKVNGD